MSAPALAAKPVLPGLWWRCGQPHPTPPRALLHARARLSKELWGLGDPRALWQGKGAWWKSRQPPAVPKDLPAPVPCPLQGLRLQHLLPPCSLTSPGGSSLWTRSTEPEGLASSSPEPRIPSSSQGSPAHWKVALSPSGPPAYSTAKLREGPLAACCPGCILSPSPGKEIKAREEGTHTL